MIGSDIATRVDRLFTLAHRLHEPERSAGSVAAAVTAKLGTHVDEETIVALRHGTLTDVPVDLLVAVAEVFGAPANYLTELDATDAYDLQFRALIAARDAEVNGICFRGDGAGPDLTNLVSELEDLARRRDDAAISGGGTRE